MKYLILLLTLTFHYVHAQQITNPDEIFDPTPYGFSHVVSVSEGKSLVFVAGQGGEVDLDGTLANGFEAQLEQVLKNIQTALKSQNLTMDDVAKVTTLVVDHNDEKLRLIIEAFNRYWPNKNFPANTLVPVTKLALEGMQIEIEAIAVR